MALRAFVDDGFTLVGLLDAYLPGVIVEGDEDLLTKVEATVERLQTRRR